MKKGNRNTTYFIKAILVTFLFFQLGKIFATDSLRQKPFDHPYLQFADSLENKGLINETIDALEDAMEKFSREKNHSGQIISSCRLATLLIGQTKTQEAEKLLENTKNIYKKLPHNEKLEGHINYRYGLLFDYKNMPDSAIHFHEKALKNWISSFGKESKQVGYIYNAIGGIYRHTFLNYLHAEKYYSEALKIWESSSFAERNTSMGDVCYNLAITYRLKGDIEKALTYANKAKSLYQLTNDNLYLSICQNLIANIYLEQNDLENAVKNQKDAIRLMKLHTSYSLIYLPGFYIGLSHALQEQGKEQHAVEFLNEAMQIARNQTNDTAKVAEILINKGKLYANSSPDKAIDFFKNGIVLNENMFGENHPITANSYIELGRFYLANEEYRLAKSYINKALEIKGLEQILSIDINENNLDADVDGILDGLTLLAMSDSKLYKQTKNLDFLELAWKSYLDFDHILSKFRISMPWENSKIELARNYKPVYESALNCAFELFEVNPSSEISYEIFELIEKTKALALSDFIHQNEINSSLGIPDSLSLEERRLETEINFFSSKVQKSKITQETELLQNKIFDLDRKLKKLKTHLANNYSEYFQLKYENKVSPLNLFKTFLAERNSILVEYFYGDSTIFVVGVAPEEENIIFKKVGNKKEVDKHAKIILSQLSQDYDLIKMHSDFYEYCTSAFELYKLLLEPVVAGLGTENKNIIIVPDGTLSFIPFEALITKKVGKNKVDYSKLPYLLNQFPLSYSFSSQVLLKKNNTAPPDLALIFDYGRSIKNTAPTMLKGGSDETAFIANQFPSLVFSGENATKSNFKKHLGEAGIIHLALHGQGDRENSLNSTIQFWNDKNSKQDAYLYYHELMTLATKARLTVLSACETGIGVHKEGEGVFNLARGFRYAGCPSLIASLWNINDRSTAFIIKRFYSEIKLEKNLDKALQLGKLAYLKSGDELSAHPRYWAGMILFGDAIPIKIYQKEFNPFFTFLLFAICVLAFAIWKFIPGK